MQKSKTYDIMNLTGTADNKDKTKQFSGLGLNNTNSSYTFDPLGDVNKNLFKTKTDDYKDTEYKEEHKKPNAETKLLQETLNKNGYKGSDNKPLVVDGIYGPNTEYAHNNAVKNNWKNLNQTQLDIERDVISSAVNKVYSSLMEKADNRKLNMSQEDVKTLQKILNDGGYTDLQGNALVVDGILGDKTKYAFEKYIQGDIPKAEVFELQKILNKYDIKDRNQKALAVDGKLGPKTDSAVYNAVAKYSNKKSNKTLDKISDFLTWASLIPGFDTLSNLAAIPVDLLRGDYVSAALSAAGMIPYFGEAADAARLARVADKTVDMAKVVDKVSDAGKVADKTLDTAKVMDTATDGAKIIKEFAPSELTKTHKLTLSEKQYNELVESIKRNGITEPIKYVEHNGTKYVVDGHHRLRAAKELGLDKIPTQKVSLPYKGYKTINDLLWLD